MKRITMLLFILIMGAILSCSKNEAETKIYRTAIGEPTLRMYPEPENASHSRTIMEIPFKSKVEVIDNKSVDRRVKIKYKDTIGYVHENYLSEKDDVPFIDGIKYDYSVHEFDYDKISAIKALKKYMINDEYYKNRISYYIY